MQMVLSHLYKLKILDLDTSPANFLQLQQLQKQIFLMQQAMQLFSIKGSNKDIGLMIPDLQIQKRN